MLDRIVIIETVGKTDRQIVFISNGFIENVEVYEKSHDEWIDFSIVEYTFLQ
jgi:hypothetical protein